MEWSRHKEKIIYELENRKETGGPLVIRGRGPATGRKGKGGGEGREGEEKERGRGKEGGRKEGAEKKTEPSPGGEEKRELGP